MKKIVLLMALAFIGTSVYAEISMPGAPSYSTPEDATSSTPSSAFKKSGYPTTVKKLPELPKEATDPLRDELDAIAMDILRAAEKRDDAAMQAHFQKLVKRGNIEKYIPPTIQVRPQGCPYKKYITINGRKLSGNTCADMGYEYKGKMREVGYCK